MNDVKRIETDQGTLSFDPDGHTYTLEGKKLTSSTDVTGILDKSGPLMGWAVKETAKSMRNQLDPDTEYTKNEIEEMIKNAKGARWRTSQEALNIGSRLHRFAENHIKDIIEGGDGLEEDLPDQPEVLEAAVEFLDWSDKHVEEWIASEEVVLIDTPFEPVGGTFDAIADTDYGRLLIDFKTSKGVYESHVLQLGGYYHGATECLGYDIDGICVLRCPKDEADVETWIETEKKQILDHAKSFVRASGLYFWRENLDV